MLKLQTVAENFIIKRYNYARKIDMLLEDEYNYDAYNKFIEYRNAIMPVSNEDNRNGEK